MSSESDSVAGVEARFAPTDETSTDTEAREINLEYELSETKPVIDQAPTDCPVCGGTLDAGPYGTWICWDCRTTHRGQR